MVAFTLNSFVAMLRMSKQHFIVVEGKEDRDFVLNLREKFNLPHRQVYPASEMRTGFSHPKNNRKKVEEIGGTALLTHTSNRLTCLVDREFREFDLQNLSDKIGSHHSIHCTYWTSGHSFENYFFLPELLTNTFSLITTAHWHTAAEECFLENFDLFSRIAACLSIADYRIGKSGLSTGLKSEMFNLLKNNGASLSFDTSHLEKIIKSKLDHKAAIIYLMTFSKNLEKIKKRSSSEVTKLIRGHTGICLFQTFYAWSLSFTAPKLVSEELRDSKIKEALETSNETIFKQLLRCYMTFLDSMSCRARIHAYPRQFMLR